MTVSLTRRSMMIATLGAVAAGPASARSTVPDFARIERRCGGKLGLSVIDTRSGRTLSWRGDRRFPLCSSAKAPLAAFVLWKADRGELALDRLVPYGAADLLPYAPITRPGLAKGGLTIAQLCEAAVSHSDNTAANLLWRETGGPAALTAWMKAQGDAAFDLSAIEPALNLARYGDARNSTTPWAMAQSLQRIVLGDILQPASRQMLIGWLCRNVTGAKRLRAGLPTSWQVGDKTGTYNERWFSTIDVGVVWPPARRPLVIAGFVTDTPDTASAETALAEVARQVAAWAG